MSVYEFENIKVWVALHHLYGYKLTFAVQRIFSLNKEIWYKRWKKKKMTIIIVGKHIRFQYIKYRIPCYLIFTVMTSRCKHFFQRLNATPFLVILKRISETINLLGRLVHWYCHPSPNNVYKTKLPCIFYHSYLPTDNSVTNGAKYSRHFFFLLIFLLY